MYLEVMNFIGAKDLVGKSKKKKSFVLVAALVHRIKTELLAWKRHEDCRVPHATTLP